MGCGVYVVDFLMVLGCLDSFFSAVEVWFIVSLVLGIVVGVCAFQVELRVFIVFSKLFVYGR